MDSSVRERGEEGGGGSGFVTAGTTTGTDDGGETDELRKRVTHLEWR